ncbi:MAG: DGQHR domain-containing protein [Prochloraceae cyanobacterium]
MTAKTADKNKILVHKTQMGNTESYLGAVSLEWLANRVSFASQLPLFQNKFDANTNNVAIDPETIEEILQRPLDWSRQAALTQYLITKKDRKFPAVLVVISPEWVDNPNAPEWDNNKRANISAAFFTSEDDDIGFLDISAQYSIYALDGQHRLMGILGLMELISTGELPRYSKTKKPTGKSITVDRLIETYNLDRAVLKNIIQEKIGIEFIPAVIKGETRTEAKRRIRSIFVHVNLMAQHLSKGQLALLNEDNGFSILARRVAVIHPLFKDLPQRHPRINWDSATVSAKSTVLTTLQALENSAQSYLDFKFPHWKPADKNLIPLRPEADELEEGLELYNQLWDCLAALPSYQQLDRGKETLDLRRFSHEKPPGEGNLLFRPVGQVALIRALGILVFRKDFLLADIFTKLRQYDNNGGFTNIDFPDSLCYGVLFDPNKRRVLVSGKDLATRLFVYILGGIEDKMELAFLRRDLAEARTIEGRSISFDGRFVAPKNVGLPAIL